MIWAFLVMVMAVVACGASMAVVAFAEMPLSALGGVGAIIFVLEGVTFLTAFWLSNWTQRPVVGRTRNIHDAKLLRRENALLQKTVHQQERLIDQLETTLARQNTQTAQARRITQAMPPAPPPTPALSRRAPGRTGVHPRIETREMTQTTGEYHVVNTPSYTALDGTVGTSNSTPEGRHRTTTTGTYRAARDTGTHPIVQTGRVPRPRDLPPDANT
ncbi:MAG: hypothetical protein AAF125_10015 [Chloroflexota bacterium]